MKKITQENIKGLFIPLITPMQYGEFDKKSMKNLIISVEKYVDGYVPCLSSGEGNVLTDEQWVEVVSFVRSCTKKPIIAGIKRDNIESILYLAHKAEQIGCEGFITPVPSNDWSVTKKHFDIIAEKTNIPFMIYNTETAHIDSLEQLKELDTLGKILSIKDSSMNNKFFSEICNARAKKELNMTVLQGMEHQLTVPYGCDGYLVSLLNVEPQLVQSMFSNPNKETEKEIYKKFMSYNLGSDWYITLKALLFSRGIITSAEQVQQFITLDDEILKELRSENKVSDEYLEIKGIK